MPPVATADEFILQLALESGLITKAEVAHATATNEIQTEATTTYQRLVRSGALDASKAFRLLADRFGMKTVDLNRIAVTTDVLELVTRAQALHYRLLPLHRVADTLEVAIADPLDSDGIDALVHLLRLTIVPRIAPVDEIIQAIGRFYGEEETGVADLLHNPTVTASTGKPDRNVDEESSASDAPVIKLVHTLIAHAVKHRASDIHLEPLERRFRVRFRIDGVLIPYESPPKRLQAVVISRLKIMAGISIAEKRLPQDGRIQITLGERTLDLRVSSLPTSHGEGIVMRILDQESLKFGLGELGFMEDDRATFDRLIAQPDGIMLVTGPTGSGKTTTLYSCLHAINTPDRKIITVEDPIEYQMSGINQVPVRAEVGMTFATALRAILRQAPNIVMVGEIRDLETAEIAIHASLTGHMVFSTLHTNDAPGAVTRLVDIGVKPFLVSTALRGVLAQRLVRKICPACGQVYEPDLAELRQLNITPAQSRTATFRRGKGCAKCHHTGYQGRMGIFELMVIDDDIRQLIHAGASAAKLRAKARLAGMRSLREDGLRKVIAGLTTIEEVVSLTIGDAS
ncbi:MAG: Flp pilus assembly complex ATPase component TadA [Cephaloticoccus sp.]|nr:Flp pilus assembly complex ATPase component TadA [Cephaloticoccus sp.]MCF7760230.1 Flp pilus assembly complex ATPase component TadA [Cephaloticoccus sp.]